jgi:shikimate dehydrogenase
MTFFHFGLTGHPLGHSLSPLLHAAALRAAGLEGEYRLYPVLPLPGGQAGLQALVNRLRKGELHGLNVTIPHKSSILSLLDELTPIAGAVGAVNTIYRIGDRLVGDNTDVGGFSADLERLLTRAGRNFPMAGSKPLAALVLGAGGSARAVVYVLAQAGFQVWVAARRGEQAQELAVTD